MLYSRHGSYWPYMPSHRRASGELIAVAATGFPPAHGRDAYVPGDVRQVEFERLSRELLDRLMRLPGLTATASDVLDEIGRPMVVPADTLCPRGPRATVAGHAVTLRYLPERRSIGLADRSQSSRLGHEAAFAAASAGDVVVIDACATPGISSCGGMGALAARDAGLRALVVDGAIRDVDEFEEVGFPSWSRSVTPRTGKGRIEAVSINAPVCCGGEQVVPGDLVLADVNGVCFVPLELASDVAARVLEVAARELATLRAGTGTGR